MLHFLQLLTYIVATLMGSKYGESNPSVLLEPACHIWNQSLNYINSLSLKCAVELGIPEIIHKHGQPMTLSDLISALPIHPTKSKYVSRLMAHLVHSGFFQVHDEANHDPNQQAYSLTPASSLLVKDGPFCVTPLVSLFIDPINIKPMIDLSTWFQNDDTTAFKTSHGEKFYEKHMTDPRLGSLLNEAMASDSKLICRVVVSKCREMFHGLKSLIDVGGGTGTMGRAIAEGFPDLECTVFDQPHVVAGLQGTGNLKYVGGNMVESIPPADAVLLKFLMVDWSDEICIKILKGCKEAITSGGRAGKVIIIEMVLGETKGNKESAETHLLFDMLMMGLVEGKVRNETEWAKLFSAAGFSRHKIHPVLGISSLIEVFP